MNLDQLRYIVEIAKTGSISKASKNLYISQSALSQSIDQLEEEVNLKLFVRDTNGSRTTIEGLRIVDHAQSVLKAMSNLKAEARQLQDEKFLSFKLGVSNELFAPFAYEINQFQKKNPNFLLSIVEENTKDIIQAVEDQELNLGFIVINQAHYALLQNLKFTYCLPAQFRLYMSKDHPLAKKKEISIADLKAQKFVLFKDEYIDDFVKFFEMKYGSLKVSIRTTAFKLVLDTLRNNQSISVIRDTQFNNNLNRIVMDDLLSFDLSHIYPDHFALGWISNPKRKFMQLENEFVEALNQGLKRVGK
ncbi:LysR family transcriptional regulator [Aerococcus sanguinicola]